MADYSWEDMPEGLADVLYDLEQGVQNITTIPVVKQKLDPLLEWLREHMEKCSAGPYHIADLPTGRCGELPVVGSQFCPLHLTGEELGDNG